MLARSVLAAVMALIGFTGTGSQAFAAEPAKGRFWIGKSAPGALAEATQLRAAGSWV